MGRKLSFTSYFYVFYFEEENKSTKKSRHSMAAKG